MVAPKEMDVAQASQIAQDITAITSFTHSDQTIDRLLGVLRAQPLVSAASLWKIKRETKTLCAKGRTGEAFKLDPRIEAHHEEFVCRYDNSVIGDIITNERFRNNEPNYIDDITQYQHDPFFRGVLSHAKVPLRRVIILPLKSYKRSDADNPSFFLIIYLSENEGNIAINEALLHAIANKASSTLSSQIERNQNQITEFIKDITNKSQSLEAILPDFMSVIVPKYFCFVHAVLLWRPSGSQRYECRYSNRFKASEIKQDEVDAIAQVCVETGTSVKVLFDYKALDGRCREMKFTKSAIVAPIRNQETGENPHGFILLLDKLSPLALRLHSTAMIIDRFDWEDELMMRHAVSMLGMVVGLLNAEERRKQLADQMAHEVNMPATYIYATADELISDYDEPGIPSPSRHKRHLANIQSYAHLQLALCDGILLGLRDDVAAPAERYNPTRVDLYELAREIVRITFPFCEQHDVRNDNIRVTKTLPILHVDQSAFMQVLLNLVSNAIKYNGDAGFDQFRVQIDCEFVALADIDADIVKRHFGIRYNPTKPNEIEPALRTGHIVTIEDDGIGIGKQYAERIFQRYFRVPGVQQFSARGSGLGLSIVKRIIGDHFGAIWLESNAKPTRFAIYLPSKISTKDYVKDPGWRGDRK
ncbi:MAG TPA: ATP-binding protein [Rhizomicrobium sp.]